MPLVFHLRPFLLQLCAWSESLIGNASRESVVTWLRGELTMPSVLNIKDLRFPRKCMKLKKRVSLEVSEGCRFMNKTAIIKQIREIDLNLCTCLAFTLVYLFSCLSLIVTIPIATRQSSYDSSRHPHVILSLKPRSRHRRVISHPRRPMVSMRRWTETRTEFLPRRWMTRRRSVAETPPRGRQLHSTTTTSIESPIICPPKKYKCLNKWENF